MFARNRFSKVTYLLLFVLEVKFSFWKFPRYWTVLKPINTDVANSPQYSHLRY